MSQITTHILDTAKGMPAAGVNLALFHMTGDGWQEIAVGRTNTDGRVAALLDADTQLAAGCYRMHFSTEAYFAGLEQAVFYPYVDVVFNLGDGGEHYHIPLLLAPYGYSTYRGS